MARKPANIDEYLATVADDEKRAALEKLRKTIRAAVPKAEECISYGLAAFRLNGKPFAGFSASAKHCSFFPMSGSTTQTMKADLEDFETTKGSIQFQPQKPIPAALIRKIIKTRLAENDR